MKNLKQLLMGKKNMKESIRNIKNRDELTENSRDKREKKWKCIDFKKIVLYI